MKNKIDIRRALIIGGAGFLGKHFTDFIIKNRLIDEIYLCDINYPEWLTSEFSGLNIYFISYDIRKVLEISIFPRNLDLIINLAAIHREPGHLDQEFFATNLVGAENTCNFAEIVGCNNIIFTSSISPYGVSESVKDESTLPIPVTAYGSSKLVSEKIHQIWQAKDSLNRRLVIVRPGVVFGPGEGGNVSRLIKAVLNRYFFYMGNKGTRKAGIYVKELCNAIWWVFKQQEINGENVSLFNMSMNPGPSIQEYVNAVCSVAKVKRFVPSIPYEFLIGVAYGIDFFAKLLRIKHPFSPVRIRKLVRSNNILPTYLLEHGYHYQFTLESALADWKKECPEEWR